MRILTRASIKNRQNSFHATSLHSVLSIPLCKGSAPDNPGWPPMTPLPLFNRCKRLSLFTTFLKINLIIQNTTILLYFFIWIDVESNGTQEEHIRDLLNIIERARSDSLEVTLGYPGRSVFSGGGCQNCKPVIRINLEMQTVFWKHCYIIFKRTSLALQLLQFRVRWYANIDCFPSALLRARHIFKHWLLI